MKNTIYVFLIIFSFSLVSNAYAWRGHNSHQSKRSYGTFKIYINKNNHNRQRDFRHNPHRFNRSTQGYFKEYRPRTNRDRLHYLKKHNHKYDYKRGSTYGYPGHRYKSYGSGKHVVRSRPSGIVENKSSRSPIRHGKSIPDAFSNHENSQIIKDRVAISRVWIPPEKERIWIPGSWSYGIRKTWRGDHWHYETDPNDRKWIEGYFESRVVEPGYFRVIK